MVLGKFVIDCLLDNPGHMARDGWYAVAFLPNDQRFDKFVSGLVDMYGRDNVYVWEDEIPVVYPDRKVVSFRR